ncbi:MAG: glycosyltransferase [Atopobiaceae bacterium]
MPEISVCMPTYNGSKYIKEAIESVLLQTFADFELVITDDCSKDDTLEVVSSFNDPRIKVYRNQKNLGLVGNWNECVSKASGAYVQFFFQDDVMEKDNLMRKHALMTENPRVSLCFSASCIIDANDAVTMKRRPFKKTQVFDGHDFAVRAFRTHNVYGEPSNVMLKREAMRKVGEFNSILCYSPDWEYWIRMSLAGDVGYVDEYLTNFRVASESTTSGLFAETNGKIAQDDRDFIESLRGIHELGITDADVKAHQRSTKLRNFEKRVYFAIKGKR